MCHFEEVGELLRAAVAIPEDEKQDRIECGYDFVTTHTWDKVCEDWISYFESIYSIK